MGNVVRNIFEEERKVKIAAGYKAESESLNNDDIMYKAFYQLMIARRKIAEDYLICNDVETKELIFENLMQFNNKIMQVLGII